MLLNPGDSSGPAGLSGQTQQALMLGSIHPDVRGAVYAMGALSGNDALFSQLRNLYQKVWPLGQGVC